MRIAAGTFLTLFANAACAGDFDLVVYGGSPSGVAAAVAAAEQGLRVALVSADSTVGGTMSNGLSASDIGSASAVGGFALRFFQKIRDHYNDPKTWRFEPHVAEHVFLTFLSDAGVTVSLNEQILTAITEGNRITRIVVAPDKEYRATSFIDASYPGDLIALANVPFKLGMEDLRDYDEPYAKRRQFVKFYDVEPEDEVFANNPFISSAKGRITDGMPSITYRTCATDGPNRIPYKKSENYERYAASWRLMVPSHTRHVEVSKIGTINSPFFQMAQLHNGIYDVNSGWSSFMNVPTTRAYFDDLTARTEFEKTLADYMQNWFVFLQTDSAVPRQAQEVFSHFGMCPNEFTDNGHWPYRPYLREGRRLVGRYTITQKDLEEKRSKSSSIALASYTIDGKLTQIWYENGAVYRDMGVHRDVPTYEIPYWSIIPANGAVINLAATIGVSASPVAYGSLRMEPEYMAIGEAAGTASAVAESQGKSLYNVGIPQVQDRLVERGAKIKTTSAP